MQEDKYHLKHIYITRCVLLITIIKLIVRFLSRRSAMSSHPPVGTAGEGDTEGAGELILIAAGVVCGTDFIS
jgi:hypothetical protein